MELSVLWMFQAIAGIDKKIDTLEVDALKSLKKKAKEFDCKILKQVLSSLRLDHDEIANIYTVDNREIQTGFRQMAELLDSKVSKENALLYKKSLLAMGMHVAYASGDILSSKMSNVESQKIVELALFMKMSISDYRLPPTVQDLMLKIAK